MSGKNHVVIFTVIVSLTMAIVFIGAVSADAYRICTFKGTVVENGWRNMTVKSNGQCAEVNVGWRTKYVPNRRPCIGEIVAVDFTLEDGYMKATKVVSLTPTPPSMQCFPPAPPASSVCRTVGEEGTSNGSSSLDSCVPPKPVFSTKPPAHVSDRNWSPDKKEVAPQDVSPRPPSAKAPPKTSKAEPSAVPPSSTSSSKKPVTKPEVPAEKKVITKTSPPEKVKPEVKEDDDWGAIPAFLRRSRLK